MKAFTNRQKEILDSALDIIAAHGIQRMTIKKLACAVKVTEPALYRHFTSKFDILHSILVQYKNDFITLIEKIIGSDQKSVEKIELLYHYLFQWFVRRPALSMIIFSEDLFRYDKRLSREVFAIIEMTHNFIYRVLKDGARHGEIRTDVPIKQMAWMVMGTMRLLITKWRISEYSLDLVKEGKQVMAFIRKIIAGSIL